MAKFVARAVVFGLVALGLTACGSPPVDCPALIVGAPAAVAPGTVLEVRIENAIPGCNVMTTRTSAGSDTVELHLVSVDTRQEVLATGSAAVSDDGTALVPIAIPADAAGHVSIENDGVSLGTISVDG